MQIIGEHLQVYLLVVLALSKLLLLQERIFTPKSISLDQVPMAVFCEDYYLKLRSIVRETLYIYYCSPVGSKV